VTVPFALVLAQLALSGPAQAGRVEGDVTAIRAGKVYTGTGAPIERAWIVIKAGKVVEVRAGGDAPAGAKVVDASSKVVIPGLVAAHTSLADGGRDGDESVAPDVRALDGFDFFDGLRAHLSGGVTTAYVSPGSKRLVSGQGAVVKTAGKGPKERTLAAAWGLHVTLGEPSKNPPEIFKPPVPPTAENPILPARRQYPASRMGQFAALREAALKPGPFADKTRPLVFDARESDDLLKAVLLAEELGRKAILVDAEGAPEIADVLAAKKIPVIYNPSYAPGRRGVLSEPAAGRVEGLEGMATLMKAGVKAALHAPEDGDLRELLFIAAAAVRGGLTAEEALAAVTRVPAEILGVGDRVGTLAPGRDADLVILSGDPFGGAAAVERVLIEGEVVFERKEGDVQTYRALRDTGKPGETIVIRAARILTGGPGVVSEGLVIVEGGKIAFVGRGRPVPAGARLLDAPGGTVAPGFIDFGGWIGLEGDKTERGTKGEGRAPAGAALTTSPSLIARLSAPAFAAASASGVTTVLLAPEGTGPCGLLRLSAGKATVLRETAALKVSAQGGTAGLAALRESVTRARKYHEEWEAFERAKKERGDAITGKWTGTLDGKTDFTLNLKLDGTKAAGTFQSAVTAGVAEPVEGTFEKDELKLSRKREGFEVELAAKPAGPHLLKGTWRTVASGKESKGSLEARRAVEEAKAPKKDEPLEPWRRVFRREIPVIAVARDVPAIENAVKVFRADQELDLVLAGSEEAAWAGDALAGRGAGVVLSPELILRDRRGGDINAAEALAAQGVPVAFASGGAARDLPLGAAWAVRHGLDAADALRAMTATPARMLRMESRIGAIERGRDADLVVFDGDPFSPASRVKWVLVEGKIVAGGK
jgi:imidazolonepropionase-like amidohydrolase